MVVRTVSRLTVEFTAWLTSPRARSSSTDCANSAVRSFTCCSSRSAACALSPSNSSRSNVFLAEDFGYAPHFRDLIAAGNVDRSVVAAARNGQHAAAQTREPADEIAADIEPYDQN